MTPAPSGAWAVETDRFTKSYGRGGFGAHVLAVDSLNLRVVPGSVLGLFGPNGSGKSTTLKALAGLVRPSAGSCRIFGHAAGSGPARALTGYLPDAPRFPAHLTPREFLSYCAGLSSLSGREAAVRVEAALAWADLEAVADTPIGACSMGMAQRAGIAQSILHDPEVFLLDEPASGLDPHAHLALDRLIRGLADAGKTVVFTSHLLGTAEELCDEIAIVGHGRLLARESRAPGAGPDPGRDAGASRLEKLYLERIGAHERSFLE